MLRHARNHVQTCNAYGTSRDCPSQSKKKCPFWIEGRHNGKRWHQSLRTADEKTAVRLVNRVVETGRLEIQEEQESQPQKITLQDAIQKFLDEQASRGAAESTIRSFRKFLVGAPTRNGWTNKQGQFVQRKNFDRFAATLLDFATAKGVEQLQDITPDIVVSFRQTWRATAITNSKQTERLRQFFRFCAAMKWIEESPAAGLKPPITAAGQDDVPVIPFSKEQMAAIISACGPNDYLKTFLLVMRYSGLATVDAVKLTPDRLQGNHLTLRRTKTNTWVKVLLPQVVADRLRVLPTHSCGYWFWNQKQNSKHETATGNMRRMLRPIFGPNGANIALKDGNGNPIKDRNGKQKYGHPYQLRHTFVLEQLQAGATLERIAELLGNTYKIVEKHYSAWVGHRQAILDETVSKSWDVRELAVYAGRV